MNDPQIWTLIGVFTTIMLGGMTLMTTLITRTMNYGFQAVNARFETVDTKLEHLDRDVQALTRRVFGQDRA